MTAVRRLLTTFLMSLVAATMLAQDAPVQRTTERVTAETDRDVSDPRALRLSLSEAVNIAVNQNLGVQIQTFETQIAGQNYRGEYGLFDFITAANAQTASSRNPAASTFFASGSRTTEVNASVNQIIPTGGQYSFGLTNLRGRSIDGGFNVNPRWETGLQFSFLQPLMRDFGVDITRRGITIARNNLGVTRGAFRNTLMDTVHLVEQSYLDLIYYRRNVEVVKESLFLARDQARITQIRIDVGAAAPLDILQPRVQVATTEETLVTAVAAVRSAEDRLRALLNLPQEEWDRPIIPTQDDVAYQPMTVDMKRAVELAIANRPEIEQNRLISDTLRVQSLYARNQTLPTVDFELGYNLGGLAGRELELDPDGEPTGRVLNTGYGDALSQIFGLDFPSWNVGVNFGLPILNINARAAARAAELDLQQQRTTEAQIRQNIIVDVRGTARAIDEFARTIAASASAREAAERNVDAARRRYENGMATNFEVLQVQQQLADARVRELLALVGYRKAVAAYHRAIGDILDVHQIRVAEPEEVEVLPDTFFDRVNWLNYGSRVRSEDQPNDDRNR
jgi:outer membrane protein TolC